MFKLKKLCFLTTVVLLGLSGCRTATSSSSAPFFPESLLVKSNFMENGNFCFGGTLVDEYLKGSDNFARKAVIILRGDRIFPQGEDFYFEDGRKSPVTWGNMSDFQNDIEIHRIGCSLEESDEISMLDDYSYLIQPPKEFWTGYSIDSVQRSEMTALGASDDDIYQALNEMKLLSLGLYQEDFQGEANFGLVIRFFQGEFAEGGIYSHALQSIVGYRILYTFSENISERGHHDLTLSGITCDIADDERDITYTTEFGGGSYSRQIESCTVSEYDELVIRRGLMADEDKEFSSEHDSFSFTLLRPDPILPTVMALDFQELLDPDFSDEILRADR